MKARTRVTISGAVIGGVMGGIIGVTMGYALGQLIGIGIAVGVGLGPFLINRQTGWTTYRTFSRPASCPTTACGCYCTPRREVTRA
jgi:uncharacterized protein YcfJ